MLKKVIDEPTADHLSGPMKIAIDEALMNIKLERVVKVI